MSIHCAFRVTVPAPRLLGIEDLRSLVTLQNTGARDLAPGFFRPKDEHALRGYLDGTLGVAYGIFDGDALRASALLRLPDAAHPNPDAKPRFPIVPEADWPRHAAFLENAMVYPDARGRGHQRTLIYIRLAHAVAAGMRWACSAAHLHNQASWANLLGAGFVLAGLIERQGEPIIGLVTGLGRVRIAVDARAQIAVPPRAKAAHRAALAEGRVGVGREKHGAVLYQRLARASAP